jgi:probable phosphoglycerate mutase
MANVQGIMSSDPAISTVDHGLSDLGREQARTSAREACASQLFQPRVAIYTSDFLRARETADILSHEIESDGRCQLHGPAPVHATPLRERYFGELNGGTDKDYPRVWAHDAVSEHHQEFGVESVASVLKRTTEFLCEVDATLPVGADGPWSVILVAHGDTLQVHSNVLSSGSSS